MISACACSIALRVGRRDRHDAVVLDVDLRAGLLLIARIVLPPGPMMSRTLSGLTCTVTMRGA